MCPSLGCTCRCRESKEGEEKLFDVSSSSPWNNGNDRTILLLDNVDVGMLVLELVYVVELQDGLRMPAFEFAIA